MWHFYKKIGPLKVALTNYNKLHVSIFHKKKFVVIYRGRAFRTQIGLHPKFLFRPIWVRKAKAWKVKFDRLDFIEIVIIANVIRLLAPIRLPFPMWNNCCVNSQIKKQNVKLSSLFKGLSAFWQICIFSIFFVLMGNFLPLQNFPIKIFLKKHSKNARLLSKVSKLQ